MNDRPETIAFWRGRLPHWEVADVSYFVTIHLAGAIPPAAQKKIKELAERYSDPDIAEKEKLDKQIFSLIEKWIDQAPRVGQLTDPRIAEVIEAAIQHRCCEGIWDMHSYVIMPNHVHFFLRPHGSLRSVIENFKRWTSRKALAILNTRRFWQREWFDHWARSSEESESIKRYITNNPVKAGLVSEWRKWPYGWWHGINADKKTNNE